MIFRYGLIAFISLLASAWFYHSSQPPLPRGRRLPLFLLRAVVIAILLTVLINPIWYYIRSRIERPQVILLTDNSLSMDLTSGNIAKKDKLKPLLIDLERKFSTQGYETHSYSFARGFEADRGSTLLEPALKELAKKHDFARVSGIVLASDGWLRDESLQIVRQLGTPFYVLADTSGTQSPDLIVQNVRSNRHAYRGEPTLIRADVTAQNYSGAAVLNLKMGGRNSASQTVKLAVGVQSSVDFSQRFNQTGFYPFNVEISATGVQERSLSNNSFPGAIEVLSEKERLVIITDKPGWDQKFIVDSIKENPRWEALTFILKDGEVFQGEQRVNAINLANPAAIIVINNGELKPDEASRNYIMSAHQKGIGILWQGMPLSEFQAILPLRQSNISAAYQGFLQLSPAAANYSMMTIDAAELPNIPPLDYYYLSASADAEVLAVINNPQSSPAIAIRSASKGRVIAYGFLYLWKWQLQSRTSTYKKLMANSIAWLTNKSESGYSAIFKPSYFLGEEILLRLHAEDEIRLLRLDLNPRLSIFDDAEKEVFSDFMTHNDGEYSLSAMLNKAGNYRFEIRDKIGGESASGRFSVSESSIEQRDFDYNLPLLSWLANDSGGKLLTALSLADFNPLPAQSREFTERKEIPIYRKWYLISLFILLFCLELFLRRRWGLL
ncbi:MAG: hypothetical protein Q8M98_05355 [Candidatus Cloacimonadaceae bacterium]|nr:hypothetical protein [Candidatus Cloacimonadaceae bacterium]MDP3114188.1 hypothetical protein [Candidatus Cloacimonadaceae bacterium]